VELRSTEKLPNDRRVEGPAESHVAKKQDVGYVEGPKSADQMQMDALLLEQSLPEEMLAQEELEMELAKFEKLVPVLNDPLEKERSLVNSNVPASSDLAPSGSVHI